MAELGKGAVVFAGPTAEFHRREAERPSDYSSHRGPLPNDRGHPRPDLAAQQAQ